MKDLPAVRWLLRVILNPGWAPLSVVALHLALAEFGLTQRFDYLLHFLGGAAIGYFCYGFIALLPPPAAVVPGWIRYLLAFTSACTVAVFWELGEFALDRLQGTSIQQSLSETMMDLFFGVLGATAALLLAAVFRLLLLFHAGRSTTRRAEQMTTTRADRKRTNPDTR
jgi:hypothetical protein